MCLETCYSGCKTPKRVQVKLGEDGLVLEGARSKEIAPALIGPKFDTYFMYLKITGCCGKFL